MTKPPLKRIAMIEMDGDPPGRAVPKPGSAPAKASPPAAGIPAPPVVVPVRTIAESIMDTARRQVAAQREADRARQRQRDAEDRLRRWNEAQAAVYAARARNASAIDCLFRFVAEHAPLTGDDE